MKFCGTCGASMYREFGTGVLIYRCRTCATEVPGTPADARVHGQLLGTGETTEMYSLLIRTAPFDRTNQLVMRDCEECGLDYMTQIRVGSGEVIIYKCKCGREETGGAAS